ncbi:MAG: hypothetical protein IPF68_20505 [Bacteroidales bacterium]|nr:hypothetical protein [Bacteroidales bacterium]
MKEKQIFIDIDVSKSTLDVFIRSMSLNYFKVENSLKGLVRALKRTIKSTNSKKQELFSVLKILESILSC